jgi:hypothetical protein
MNACFACFVIIDDLMSFAIVVTVITPYWNTTGVMVGGMGIYSSLPNGLNYPYGMALDATASNVYITDEYNNRVQQWSIGGSTGLTVAGQSNTVAGNASSYLHEPCGIVLDSTGGFYVADSSNNRVQYWTNGATNGSTIAGTGKLVRDTPEGEGKSEASSFFWISSIRDNHWVRVYRCCWFCKQSTQCSYGYLS